MGFLEGPRDQEWNTLSSWMKKLGFVYRTTNSVNPVLSLGQEGRCRLWLPRRSREFHISSAQLTGLEKLKSKNGCWGSWQGAVLTFRPGESDISKSESH
jgi:hypothetical protein